jgi:hypothetical protein
MPAALGLVPHTGWTWLVRVSGTRARPVIAARERVVACEVLEGELYHLAAERTRGREAFVATRRARAVELATAALGAHAAGASAACVVGKVAALPALEKIVASHPLIHGAEGELWRAIFAEAAAALGLPVTRADANSVRGKSDAAFLAEGKRAFGAPWTREVQDAALAARAVL